MYGFDWLSGHWVQVCDWLFSHWVIVTFVLSIVAAVTARLVYGVSLLQPLEEIASKQAKYRNEAKKEAFTKRMVERHLKWGWSFLNIEEYAAARQEYQEALKLDPANLQAELGLFKAGIYSTLQEQYNPAVIEERIQFILEEDRNDPHAYVFLGDIYRSLDNNKAIEYYEKAKSLDPKVAGAYFGLGLIDDQQNQLDAALEMFQQAVERAPHNFRYLDNLGYAYSRKKLYTQAIEVYERLLQIDADYLLAYVAIAPLWLLQGDLDKALIYQQELVKLLGDEKITGLEKNKGPWYFKAGDDRIEFYDLPEKTAYAYYSLSIILDLLNWSDEARDYVDKIPSLNMSQNSAAKVHALVEADRQRLAEERTEWVERIASWQP